MKVFIQREPTAQDLPLPSYATDGSAGMDLYAVLDTDLILEQGKRALVSTGIRLTLPEGYEGQVRPRSGLAWTKGLTLLNSPGTIDSDYSGTVRVVLINLGQEPILVQRGDRIAQLIISPVTRVVWEESEGQPTKGRGKGGFGSTGK